MDNSPEKLQKVMEFLNARVAEDKDAVDDSALDAIINEEDDDDEDFESDDDSAFESDDYDLDDDEGAEGVAADLGVTNDDVDVDDLDDLF